MADGAITATPEKVTKPLTLTQRMAAIRADASGIGKEQIKMGSYNIKAHTIEGVLHGIRALFDTHGVWMEPHLIERSYDGNRCDVIFDFHFENVDNPEDRKIIRYAGADTDNGGKGFAKAGTNALKEMLKKVFLITDREDAKEEEDAVEYVSDSGASRADVEAEKEKTRAAIEQWGKTFREALVNAATLKDVQRLERENSKQLSSETLPQVTRDFFVELIETRKAELK